MSKGTLKPPKQARIQNIAVLIVTGVFLAVGVVFTIIGFRNEILHWMATTGIALLAAAAVPFVWISYRLIVDKLNS